MALDLWETSPVEYKYVNNDSGDGMVTTFANGVKMVLERDMDAKIWHGSCGVRYEGTEGWVAIADGYSKLRGLQSRLDGRLQEAGR